MKILMVTAEAVPFAKTGGLADMVSALALSLSKLGHDVKIVMPRYYKIDRKKLQAIPGPLAVAAGTSESWVGVYESALPSSKACTAQRPKPIFTTIRTAFRFCVTALFSCAESSDGIPISCTRTIGRHLSLRSY